MSHDTPHSTSGVTRRSVIRTAGHAAWAAPVVVVATGAPAFAVSGPASVSTVVTSATVSGGVVTAAKIDIAATLTNANTQASTGLTVNLTVDLGALQWLSPSASAPGYTVTGPSGSGNSRSWVFTAATQIAGNSTKLFQPTVNTGFITVPSGTVTVTPVPGAPGSGTGGSKTF